MGKSKIKYISKRLVLRGSKKAFKQSANQAMKENGFVIVAKDGWVVKEFSDGTIEKIEKIDTTANDFKVVLD